jgi:hypothetical protein
MRSILTTAATNNPLPWLTQTPRYTPSRFFFTHDAWQAFDDLKRIEATFQKAVQRIRTLQVASGLIWRDDTLNYY